MESQAIWWGILYAPKQALLLFLIGLKSQNYFRTKLEPELKEKTVGELRLKMLSPSEDVRLTFGRLLRFILIAIFGIFCMLAFIPTVMTFTLFGFLIGVNRFSSSN